MSNVVGPTVDTLAAQSGLAGRGQVGSAREDEVEIDRPAVVGLAPDAEVAIELFWRTRHPRQHRLRCAPRGAKLDWRFHLGGQLLLITEGTGYYQERGKPIRIVHKGDVIKCAPGVEHWHGAAPSSSFAYIAVTPTQKGRTIWLKPVTDEEYNSVKKGVAGPDKFEGSPG